MIMSARTKSHRPSIVLRILIVVFCAYLIYSIGILFAELNALKAEHLELQQKIAQTEANILERDKLLTNGTIEEIIEKAARERLGYVFPNEIVYMDISGN